MKATVIKAFRVKPGDNTIEKSLNDYLDSLDEDEGETGSEDGDADTCMQSPAGRKKVRQRPPQLSGTIATPPSNDDWPDEPHSGRRAGVTGFPSPRPGVQVRRGLAVSPRSLDEDISDIDFGESDMDMGDGDSWRW